jgi:hypothetical protein
MVDSAKNKAMDDRIDDLAGRMHAVEDKVDLVSASLDQLSRTTHELSVSVDRRFDEVTAAIVEQRQYTEYAWSELSAAMNAGFTRIDTRFEDTERKIDAVAQRLDPGLARMDARLVDTEWKMDAVAQHLDSGLARLERKLDQFIDRPGPALRPRPDEAK